MTGGPFQVTNFACTGAPQTYTVPSGVTTVNVRLAGGDGGNANTNPGGLAGFGSAALAVTPGEPLTVDVGCVGQTPASSVTAGGWGYGTGGAGGAAATAGAGGGGGGGASAVLRAGTPLVVAGGGGGGAAGSRRGGTRG